MIQGLIYFVQEGLTGNIKIGYTDNIQRRIKSLQTGCPSKIRLLGYIKGNRVDEGNLHKKFRLYWYHGEWFRNCNEIIEYLNSVNEMEVYIDRYEDGNCQILKKMKK